MYIYIYVGYTLRNKHRSAYCLLQGRGLCKAFGGGSCLFGEGRVEGGLRVLGFRV